MDNSVPDCRHSCWSTECPTKGCRHDAHFQTVLAIQHPLLHDSRAARRRRESSHVVLLVPLPTPATSPESGNPVLLCYLCLRQIPQVAQVAAAPNPTHTRTVAPTAASLPSALVCLDAMRARCL